MSDDDQEVIDGQVGRVVPGLALAVVDSDGVRTSEAWGKSSIADETAMTIGTSCNWFSMTKPVTATAALQLAERGRLDLDRPIRDFYEPWQEMRPQARRDQVTVRHLLAHSSGLANPMPLRWVHAADEPGPELGDWVGTQLRRHRRLRFEPGSRARYSNLGFLVVGHIIETVSGAGFEEVVTRGVLEALAMDDTGFAPPAKGWATGYQLRRTFMGTAMPLLIPRKLLGEREDGFRSLRPFCVDGAPYGGLIGPVSDAARFLRAHLRDGELDGARILSPESCTAMRDLATPGKGLTTGMGWYQRGHATGRYVEHLGGGAGFWSCMRLYPERQLGVVMMGNATSYDHDSIARSAVDRQAS